MPIQLSDFPEQTRQINNDTYHYVQTGNDAPDVLLIHGSLCDYRYWRWQLPAFASAAGTLPANPNLASTSHEYIAKQLRDFKTEGEDPPTRAGLDGNPSAMTAIANPLTEEDIMNVSYFIGLQELNYETAATASNVETMERGQKIWRAGIAERGVPACAACHSPNGAGVPAQFPRLAAIWKRS